MTIGFAHKAVARLALAIGTGETSVKVHFTEYAGILSAPGDHIYLLLRGPVNRELIKVDISASVWDVSLSIARGQGGTTAQVWPVGSMMFATISADFYNEIEQRAVNRVIDYNPNQVLAPVFAGEEIYQSTPSRWWKSFDAVNSYWDLITGVPEAGEAYTDIGWTYNILVASGPSWTAHFDNTEFEPRIARAFWNAGGWWDPQIVIDGGSWYAIEIQELGTWVEGYEPTKFRVSIDVAMTVCTIKMQFGASLKTIQTALPLSDGQEIDINPLYYLSGDIKDIRILRSQAEGVWKLTNLEWLA